MERYNLVDILREQLLLQLPEEHRSSERVEEGLVDQHDRDLLVFCGKAMIAAIEKTVEILEANPTQHSVPPRTLKEFRRAINKSIYFKLPPVEED